MSEAKDIPPFFVIGVPVKKTLQTACKMRAYAPPRHAEQLRCGQCTERAWFGARQLKFLRDNPKTHVRCMNCCPKEHIGIAHLGGKGGSYVDPLGRLIGSANQRN